MNYYFHSISILYDYGLHYCSPVIGMLYLADDVRASSGVRASFGGCGGALGECALLVLARRSASLPWRCLSISVDSDVSNEVFDVKIVNTVNKITTDIAFERILCYNHAEKEKKHAA